MLPTLSSLSVSHRPGGRLRHWCSSRYLRISPLHREFRHPLRDSSLTVSDAVPGLGPGFHTRLFKPPTLALRPINPNNACTLRITAAAGTELAGASFGGTVKRTDYLPARILPSRQKFTTRRPSSFTRRCWVRLSPIAQYSRLLPPVGVWTVSQFQCG